MTEAGAIVLRDSLEQIKDLARLHLADSLPFPVVGRAETDFIAFGSRDNACYGLCLLAVCIQIRPA